MHEWYYHIQHDIKASNMIISKFLALPESTTKIFSIYSFSKVTNFAAFRLFQYEIRFKPYEFRTIWRIGLQWCRAKLNDEFLTNLTTRTNYEI